MQGHTRKGKRLLALVMALVMTLSTVTECLAAVIPETVTQGDDKTVTWGELAAEAYDKNLTTEEKAILKSGMLRETVTYTAPGNEDGLIAVDTETKTVSVTTSVKKGDITWTAGNVRISYEEDGKACEEKVPLDEQGDGTFIYKGNDYTVKADYTAELTMGLDEQKALLKTPRKLAVGWSGMKEIAKQSGIADVLGGSIDSLVTLVNTGMPMPGGGTVAVNESNKAPVAELKRQTVENESKALDIVDKVEKYDSAVCKTQYLIENGAEFRKVAKAYCDTVGMLVDPEKNDQCLLTAVNTASGYGQYLTEDQLNQLTTAKTALEKLKSSYEKITAILAYWEDEDLTQVFKEGMTTNEYAKMNTLVEAAAAKTDGEFTALTSETLIDYYVKNKEMRALTTTVTAQVNRNDVTVKVQANVIPLDSRDSKVTETKSYAGTLVLTLKAGMSKTEVEKAIEDELEKSGSIEKLALTEWVDFEVGTEHYVRTLTADKIYTELAENLTYTVSYEPKTLKLNVGEGEVEVPYGYNKVLPDCPTASDEYFYKLDGVTYEQGKVYRVVADTTFIRTQDTARISVSVGAIVRSSAAGENLTDAELALLKSDALKVNNETIRVRYPGANDEGLVEMTLDESTYTVTAKEANSKYKDLNWIPVSVVFDFPNGEITKTLTKGENETYTASANGVDITGADVIYELTLTGQIDGLNANTIVNLPGKLAKDAAEHKAIMSQLTPLQSSMEQITKKTIGMLATDDSLPDYTQEALDRITEECCTDNYLTVYNYVKGYTEANSGLAYLYQNGLYNDLTDQAEKLYTQLDAALGGDDAKKQEEAEKAIKELMETMIGSADQYDSLKKLRDKLKDIVARLKATPLDEQIDTSKNLTELAGLIEAVGTTTTHSVSELKYATTIRIGAPGMKQVVVRVGSETVTEAFKEDYVLTDQDVSDLESKAKAKLKEQLGEDAVFYTEGTLTGVEAGTEMNKGITAALNYAEKQVEVTVAEGNVQKICLSSLKISLPAAASGEKNVYTITIGGTVIATVKTTSANAGEYTFAKPQLKQILEGKEVKVECEAVNVNDAALREFVEGANSAINDTALSFLMLEDDKSKKVSGLILRVGIDKDFTTDAIVSFGTYLTGAGGSMDKIELAGGTFYESDGGELRLSLKVLVDTLLQSGMSLASFCKAINKDGTMNEMTVPAETTLIGGGATSGDLAGAELFATTVILTLNGNELAEMPLYVTMESFGTGKDRLANLSGSLSDVSTYVHATAENGALSIRAEVPVDSSSAAAQKMETAWGYALAAMLLTGQIDLDDVSAAEICSVVDYLYNGKLEKLYQDDSVDLNTVGNTLKKIGLAGSAAVQTLAEKNSLYQKLQAMNIEVVSKTANKTITVSAEVYDVLKALLPNNDANKSTWTLLEKVVTDETVTVCVKPEVETAKYAAMMVSSKGVSFLSEKDMKSLTVADNYSLVVLLKDCSGKMKISGQYVYVDLHGHTFDGSIAGTKPYQANNFVVDSVLDTNGNGKVTGEVTNVVLAGGTYTGNTDGAIVRGGYTKDESGRVTNDYYTVTTSDNTITVTLKATAQSLRNADNYTAAALASDLASDLLLNYYSTAQKVTVDGRMLYNAAIEDVTTLFQSGKFYVSNDVGNELLDSVLGYTQDDENNYDGINYLINDVLTKLQDLEGLKEKIGTNDPVATYKLGLTGWDVAVDKAEGDDCLAVGVTGNTENTKTQTLHIILNSDSEENNKQLQDMLGQLNEIVTFDTPVRMTLEHITIPADEGGKTVQVEAAVEGQVTVKVSDKPVYAVLTAITVANSLPADSRLRAELKDAIETFYGKNDVRALKAAVEKVTCAQLFAALKTVELQTNFLQMAINMGFGPNSAAYKAIRESYSDLTAYRGGMAAAGALLKQLSISGSSARLAGIETEFGTYVYEPGETVSKTYPNSGSWRVNGVLAMEEAKLTLELFTKEKTIVVADKDGKIIYNGENLAEAVGATHGGSTYVIRLNDKVYDSGTYEISTAVKIEGAGKLSGGPTFKLVSGGSLTSDAKLTVVPASAALRVETDTTTPGTFIYTVKAYKTQYKDENGNDAYCDSLEDAVANAKSGTEIKVLSRVTLDSDVRIGGKALTIEGFGDELIGMNGRKFILDKSNSKLTVDTTTLDAEQVALEVTGRYKIATTVSDGMTTYYVKYTGGGDSGGGSYTGNYIYLDVQPSGINAGQLQTAVRKYFGDSSAEVTVYSGLTASGLVANGASIYVSGSRAGSYTVIIMGDTNCNGRIDSGDAVKMRNHYFGTAELTGVALEAADMNRNGKVDSGDAVKNRVKYQNWSGYRSELKITV